MSEACRATQPPHAYTVAMLAYAYKEWTSGHCFEFWEAVAELHCFIAGTSAVGGEDELRCIDAVHMLFTMLN